jgi:hypothetical protein
MMARCARIFVAVLLIASLRPARAEATEWFVASGGTGPGTRTAPLGRVQDGLSSAMPGDIVTVRTGTYVEALRTVRSGTEDAPITVRAEPGGGPVLVTSGSTVLRVDHAYVVVEGLTLDAQYANAVGVDVNTGGSFLVLRRVEVRRSGRDCIDLAAPRNVLIEDSLIHHCLYPANGRSDAHGIVAGSVRDLTIRGTEIHTFSGDGIQLDPTRDAAGWDRVLVERCRIWLAPLAQAENGFASGTVPGENALDTKVSNSAPRARLVVRNTEAWGFRGTIENQAAFNLKENIDATIDGVTVWDSEIAFRLRGPTTFAGAWAVVQNAVVHHVGTAVRYEDNIQNLRFWNATLGLDVGRPLQAAGSGSAGVDVRNLLVLGSRLPPEAVDRSNLAVSIASFINAGAGDYHLTPGSPAIDTGSPVSTVATDRDGVPRTQGNAPDVGAYEWRRPVIGERPEGAFGPMQEGPRPSASGR